MTRESVESIAFLSPAAAESWQSGPFVVVVNSRADFHHWLSAGGSGMEAIEVRDLLSDPHAWPMAAQGRVPVPVDVIVSDPAVEFSALYRLVDVSLARPVRVTIPVDRPGFMKAVKLAAALRLPVRLLATQPCAEAASELLQAAEFYLRNSMVETPIEFFHSALAAFRGFPTGTLWTILEQDPALFSRHGGDGEAVLPPDFVDRHLSGLSQNGADCALCPWGEFCAGYFKWPDPAYDCSGMKKVLGFLQEAAAEISMDLEEGEILLSS